jgi:hypothetical protein
LNYTGNPCARVWFVSGPEARTHSGTSMAHYFTMLCQLLKLGSIKYVLAEWLLKANPDREWLWPILKYYCRLVNIVTTLRAERPGFDSRQGMGRFLFVIASRSALGPTHLPLQGVPEVKRPRLGADHSPLSSAQIKNAWSDTPTPPYVLMAQRLMKHKICLHGVVLR